MTYSQIEATSSGPLVRITINRPAQRNALTTTVIEELTQAFNEVGQQSDRRCVLLMGAGKESFCAGADLQELRSHPDPASRRTFFVSIAKLITTIRQCPIPVVTAIHGFALAGGLGLVAASDIALSADDGVFGLPEVAIGIAPMVVMSPLTALLTPRALSYLALSGERIGASEALAAGLITRVVAKGSLESEVKAVCDTLCQRGPEAVKATKRAIRDIPLSDPTTFIFDLADRSALVSLGAEAAEGIAAFTEKRGPSWKIG